MKLYVVYKTGGDYDIEYVNHILKALTDYNHKIEFHCITDDEELEDKHFTIPMQYAYPGWWSKMELFRPDIDDEAFLYIDLDTIIVKDLDQIMGICSIHPNDPIMLSDFFYSHKLASGVMWLPKEIREIIWNEWILDPEAIMQDHAKYGDQEFIESVFKKYQIDCKRWQSLLDGGVILSYKAHVRHKGIINNTELVCYHGQPRPHETGWALT